MRYLPSLVVFIVLCAGWVITDHAHLKKLETEKRDAASRILRSIQTQIDTNIAQTLRASRGLAAKIDRAFEIDQPAFESFIQNNYSGPANISRVELAPGFVTQYVYPMAGNESYIGSSPLRASPTEESQLVSDVKRGFPSLSKIQVDSYGAAELQVRSEIREVIEQKVVSNGLLHLVVEFDLVVDDPIEELPAGEIEFLFLVRAPGEPSPELPQDWSIAPVGFEPISYNMRYPPGDILLYAKSVNGWRPALSETINHRLRNGLFSLLLLLPVVLANWFAISRGYTRVDLSQTRQQMSGLLRTLPGAAFTYTNPPNSELPSKKDEVRFLNPKSCMEIFGVEANIAEANVSTLWEIIESPEIANRVARALSASKKLLITFDETWPIITPEGESRWLQCRAHPTRLKNGSIQWSALVLDFTETVNRDIDLEEQRELAFRAQKHEAIGQLTGGVAHDFNNLLAAILANLELVLTQKLSPMQRESLNAAIDASQRGADLTSNMLSFAKQARLKPETFNLNDVVTTAQSLIERTLPATLSVSLNLNDSLNNVSVDRGSTESALLNLILNARDAMDDRGQLTISTSTVMIHENDVDPQLSELSAGVYTVLSVSDTGPGIPPEHLKYIFEPFYTTKAPGKGSGLGLSMIMGFMQQSGGAVVVECQNGTTISLYFPTVNSNHPSPFPQKEKTAVISTDARILFAEDESTVREALTRILSMSGYQVTSASSGDEALEIFRRDNAGFDLLITDFVMPGNLQGPDLSTAVRKLKPKFPVIFITGYAHKRKLTDSEDIWVEKPVKRTNLIEAIEVALKRKELQLS